MICGHRIKLRHIEERELDAVIKLLNDPALRGEYLNFKRSCACRGKITVVFGKIKDICSTFYDWK